MTEGAVSAIMNENTVTVFNKRKPIFEVVLSDSGQLIRVGKVINKELLPICLQQTFSEDVVRKWMDSRAVPDKRIGKTKVEKDFGPTDVRHGMFSLSDQYWFHWRDIETWDSGNFFTNRYSTDYGRMYFTPWNVKRKNLKKESPDRTTNGVLPKRWTQPCEKDYTSFLIKAGNRSAHQEPISEVLASMTLAAIDILPFVEYELVVDGLKLCSRCRNFVTANTEFVPASHLFHALPQREGETTFQHMVSACTAFGIKDAEDYLLRMIAADYLICNNDRHLGNFGVIRSAETGKILRFAPLFDSGSAFFGNANKKGGLSRLFSGLENKALIYTVNKCQLSKRYKYTNLLDVIEMYPLLSGLEKKQISEQIKAVYDRLNDLIRQANSSKGG